MNLFDTFIHKSAQKAVSNVLQSSYVSEGKLVAEFEKKLSHRFHFPNPIVAVNSGTSALHLALATLGIKTGDEVILPPQTFISTALAVLYCGAVPKFADINPRTGNIDINKIQEKITHKTKAIICVHWGGYPCDLDKLQKICSENYLILIEDAAHALGSIYKNKFIGDSTSNATCFSFQAIKTLVTGDGGGISFSSIEHRDRAKRLSWFGIDRGNSLADDTGERKYNLTEIGFKYHMNDIAAAIGLANLEFVSQIIAHKSVLRRNYILELDGTPGITLLESNQNCVSSNWLFSILVENRLGLKKKLEENGIQSSVVHNGIDRNDIFGGMDKSLTNQRWFEQRQLCLPIHSGISLNDVSQICDIIKAGW